MYYTVREIYISLPISFFDVIKINRGSCRRKETLIHFRQNLNCYSSKQNQNDNFYSFYNFSFLFLNCHK